MAPGTQNLVVERNLMQWSSYYCLEHPWNVYSVSWSEKSTSHVFSVCAITSTCGFNLDVQKRRKTRGTSEICMDSIPHRKLDAWVYTYTFPQSL